MKFDSFRRGRALISYAALSALLCIVSIVFRDSVISRLFLTVAVAINFVFVAAFVSSQKRVEGVLKDSQLRGVKVESTLSKLTNELENQRREAEAASLREISGGTSSKYGGSSLKTASIFSPSAIPSTRIVGRPSVHLAGRIAAEQVMERHGFVALNAMMNAKPELWTREIVLIGTEKLEAALGEIGRVQRIVGPHLLGSADLDASYLVIDEREFRNGPWEGSLSAHRLGLYLKLVKHVIDARENGTVVIVLGIELSSHFTFDLRERADIVLYESPRGWLWSEDLMSPVIRVLMDAKASSNPPENFQGSDRK